MHDSISLFWDRCEGQIVYGVNDCCMTVADVILAAGGPDLMAPYRGRYKTQLGFMRAFRKAGHRDLPAATLEQFARCGSQVDEPRDFDVAVVSYLADGEPAYSPAFYHGGFWCLRTDRGALCTDGSGKTIYRVI